MAKIKAENTENIEKLDNEPKPTSFLISFDGDGRRIETYIANEYTDEAKQEMLNNGFVEVAEGEWRYYAGLEGTGDNGTGYVRGKDGKPVSAPAYVPTKKEKLAQLDAKYDSDKAQLREYIGNALLLGDDELISDLRAEMTALDEAYEENRGDIENE